MQNRIRRKGVWPSDPLGSFFAGPVCVVRSLSGWFGVTCGAPWSTICVLVQVRTHSRSFFRRSYDPPVNSEQIPRSFLIPPVTTTWRPRNRSNDAFCRTPTLCVITTGIALIQWNGIRPNDEWTRRERCLDFQNCISIEGKSYCYELRLVLRGKQMELSIQGLMWFSSSIGVHKKKHFLIRLSCFFHKISFRFLQSINNQFLNLICE